MRVTTYCSIGQSCGHQRSRRTPVVLCDRRAATRLEAHPRPRRQLPEGLCAIYTVAEGQPVAEIPSFSATAALQLSPLGGKLDGLAGPSRDIRTHWSSVRYDHDPSQRSSNDKFSSDVRSGITARLSAAEARVSQGGGGHAQKPVWYSFCRLDIFKFSRSSLVLDGLPGRRAFLSSSSSSSC